MEESLVSMSFDWKLLISSRRPSSNIAVKSYVGSRRVHLRSMEDFPLIRICCSISNSSAEKPQFFDKVLKRV